MVEKAEHRSRVYAVLSMAFSAPREGMGSPEVAHAAVRILRESARALGIDIPAHALGVMEERERRASVTLAQDGEGELEVEYNRLFVGPGTPCVYPYESLYRNSTGLVMGPPAGEVLQAYRRAGLAINTAFTDLPDHVAVELEFMATLCSAEARAVSEGKADLALGLRQEQRSFLDAHLATWLPTLCERVIRETTSTIYRGVAEIATTFVGWDREEGAAPRLIGTEVRT